jgi:hypothetical protein
VTTNEKDEVVELSLHRRAMEGHLSPAVGDLLALEAINVWGNGGFGGPIPDSLGGCMGGCMGGYGWW